MSRPSSVDQLPQEIRSDIGKLRMNGWTIDQIREHLLELYDRAPSRSALGRHIKGFEKIAERMRLARLMSEQLGRTVGDAKVSEAAQMNIELMNGTILELFMNAAEGQVEGIEASGRAALAGDPRGIMEIAKAMDHLARASKSNTDLVIRVRREVEAEQQKKLEAMERAAAKAGTDGRAAIGFDPETLRRVRAEIYGIAA